MKYCTHCGQEVQPGAAFCTHCGAKLEAPIPTPAPSQQQTPPPVQQTPPSQQQTPPPVQQTPPPQQMTPPPAATSVMNPPPSQMTPPPVQQTPPPQQMTPPPAATSVMNPPPSQMTPPPSQQMTPPPRMTPPPVAAPIAQLKTNRSLLKFILLSLVTFGIYSIVVMSSISTDINTIASRYDGKKTMHYCLVLFVLSGLTLGIFPLIWKHQLSERIGNELTRRGIDFQFGAETFWLWGVLGSFILVGPFIYTHKLLQSMNLLCEDYNVHG